MEYGMNRSAIRFQLSRHVEIARTCLQQVGNQVCDLDSVMEFSLKQVADQLVNQLARELDRVMEFAKFHYAIQLASHLASWFASRSAIC